MRKSTIVILVLLLVIALGAILWLKKDARQRQRSREQVTVQDSTEDLWYKKSIFYTLDVEVFKDSDNDGFGDFKGLTSRLGYIDSLGADAIWLAPFQPSPGLDDGYDVKDYYNVDERLGTLADFDAFIKAAKSRGIRVIMDLVVNHTSDKHPWFVQARRDKNSPYRSWYVWSDDKPKNHDKGMVFPGVQKAIWTFDSVSKEYYYHRFYKFQPDLNMQNPAVVDEIRKVIKFWMARGINGFRLDGVPFFIEVPQETGEKFEHQYELLKAMRRYVDSLDSDAIILGEANVLPDENKDFFGEHGDGMHMMFNFFVNQHLFFALATGNTGPLVDALERTKEIPEEAEWGQFLRNHDEVDLGRLTKKERQAVYDKFGPDKDMQLYDRGIRRRLAPMMKNDPRHLELAYSVLLSLPSTPVLRYGDEIGMGDDLGLQERLSVRTPMQWNDEANAGFTRSRHPVRPVIGTGEYAFETVNVEDAWQDPNSLLNWTRSMINLRNGCPEIAFGDWQIINSGSDNVLAMLYNWRDRKLLVVHNFSDSDQTASFDKDVLDGQPLKNKLDETVAEPDDSGYTIPLRGFEYKWYSVRQ
ncbi:MAG TPA: alpha-amylase family protein [Ohtaekwangia sp.]|nr:alpha-amylase family protein [Ohtaekwangia sp.]